jgi:NADH-quinone oxidoreductase subunit J
MEILFYISGVVAIVATLFMLTRRNAVHALLDLIVSLLAVALVFYSFGAPFAAALEVIVYAGAIMVLFVFAVMLLDPRDTLAAMHVKGWAAPAILAAILMAELISVLVQEPSSPLAGGPINPKEVGIALFGPYLIGVELASVLLLSGLVGAFHLGERSDAQPNQPKEDPHVADTHDRRTDSGSDLVLAGTDRPSRSA